MDIPAELTQTYTDRVRITRYGAFSVVRFDWHRHGPAVAVVATDDLAEEVAAGPVRIVDRVAHLRRWWFLTDVGAANLAQVGTGFLSLPANPRTNAAVIADDADDLDEWLAVHVDELEGRAVSVASGGVVWSYATGQPLNPIRPLVLHPTSFDLDTLADALEDHPMVVRVERPDDDVVLLVWVQLDDDTWMALRRHYAEHNGGSVEDGPVPSAGWFDWALTSGHPIDVLGLGPHRVDD